MWQILSKLMKNQFKKRNQVWWSLTWLILIAWLDIMSSQDFILMQTELENFLWGEVFELWVLVSVTIESLQLDFVNKNYKTLNMGFQLPSTVTCPSLLAVLPANHHWCILFLCLYCPIGGRLVLLMDRLHINDITF